MIDLHSHIIYGVDDGSVDREMSLELLRLAARTGTTAIFCTPHCLELHKRPSWSLIEERAAELQQLADAEDLHVRVYTGAEVMLGWEMLDIYKEAHRAYCLGGSSYALVELPMHELPLCTDDFWYQMELLGLTPVLAHPERYTAVPLELLLKWAQRGVLLQINAGSLLGKFGPRSKERAERLLYNGMVAFLGSDAHRVEVRNTDLSGAYAALVAQVGAAKAEEIAVTNPQLLLQDRLIEIDLPERVHHLPGTRGQGRESQPAKKKSLWSRIFG